MTDPRTQLERAYEAVPAPPPVQPTKVVPLFETLPVGQRLIRIFSNRRPETTATSFRGYGPLERFDHHEGDAGRACQSETRSVYYAAFDLAGCLVEVFGNRTRVIEFDTNFVAGIEVVTEIKLLDLRKNGAMLAGTEIKVTSCPRRDESQPWARWFYERNEVYGLIDGIIYPNSHNASDAIILFDRAESKIKCEPHRVIALDHPGLRAKILEIANNNGLVLPE